MTHFALSPFSLSECRLLCHSSVLFISSIPAEITVFFSIRKAMPLPVRQSACPHNHFHSKAISRFAVSFRKEGVLLDEKVGQEEGNVVEEGAAI